MTTMTAQARPHAQAQRFREFRMPDVGEGLTEAEILKWYVAVGDTVTDGQVVCEAAAIIMQLADRSPAAGLAPPLGTHERAQYYQWMFFMANIAACKAALA